MAQLISDERLQEMVLALPDKDKEVIIKSLQQYIDEKPASRRVLKAQIIKLRRSMNGS